MADVAAEEWLIDELERFEVDVGNPASRRQLARRAIKHGMTPKSWALVSEYVDQSNMHAKAGFIAKRLQNPDDWRDICRVQEKRRHAGVNAKPEHGQSLSGTGSGYCMHGVPQGHHCESCDPVPVPSERLERMRKVMFDDLVAWMMRDIPTVQPRATDDEKAAEQKRQRASKIERMLRAYLMAVGGDGKGEVSKSVMSTEDRQWLESVVPMQVRSRRKAEAQRFPGEGVGSSRRSFIRWAADANEATEPMRQSGELVGRQERASEPAQAECADPDAEQDGADEWAEITEGAF